MGNKWLTTLTTAGSTFATVVFAQAPVAVVEEVTGGFFGVEFMDFVSAGKVILLGASGHLVLGYLKSCWQETITGGTVNVGIEQSEVLSGKVSRVKVECSGGNIQITAEQTNQSAAMAFRRQQQSQLTARETEATIYHLSPIIELNGDGTLVVTRLDIVGERYEIPLDKTQLVRGAFYDFVKSGKKLTAGGIYRASFGMHQMDFKVDPAAKTESVPIISRLLRLDRAGTQ
jgi:hypothetical protein